MQKPHHVSLPPQVLLRCRELRCDATDAEALGWHILRNRALEGIKFRRQHPFEGFILDFYCNEARLSIELDGSGHLADEQMRYDALRTQSLEAAGIHELRFWNSDVMSRTEEVLNVIWDAVQERLG